MELLAAPDAARLVRRRIPQRHLQFKKAEARAVAELGVEEIIARYAKLY